MNKTKKRSYKGVFNSTKHLRFVEPGEMFMFRPVNYGLKVLYLALEKKIQKHRRYSSLDLICLVIWTSEEHMSYPLCEIQTYTLKTLN